MPLLGWAARAAIDHLSITPTAISHHIQGLEDTLEVTLFLRAGREVELTEDGKRLAENDRTGIWHARRYGSRPSTAIA